MNDMSTNVDFKGIGGRIVELMSKENVESLRKWIQEGSDNSSSKIAVAYPTCTNARRVENKHLIFSVLQWKRLVSAGFYKWTDEEIEAASKSESGLIGTCLNVDCYVTKFL